ncbi:MULTISPECIES: hypothetical protein [unclassified Isoptericola]|uniref:hypothetical protein n=1 Tax=unclassified Isoptericola TaxID=2623355 RepID=UPI003669DAD2
MLGRPAPTLALWEALAATAPPARGAAVLVARGVAPDLDAACALPLAAAAGAALAELRERAGDVLETVVTCPSCGELLDVPLPLDGVAVGGDGVVGDGVGAGRLDGPEVPDVEAVGPVEVRAPTTADLLAALAAPDPAAALRHRCVRRPAGAGLDGADLADPELAERVAAAAERLVGAAGVSVRLRCPGCDTDVRADVDVVSLLTDRVAEQARAELADVATLAAAFGWTEPQVLDLSPARRAEYLALAEQVLVRGGGGAR